MVKRLDAQLRRKGVSSVHINICMIYVYIYYIWQKPLGNTQGRALQAFGAHAPIVMVIVVTIPMM